MSASDQARKRQKRRTDAPVFVGVEVGELGAWMSVASGADRLHARWRMRFAAPPTESEALESLTAGVHEVAGTAPLAGAGIAVWGYGAARLGVTPDQQTSWLSSAGLAERVQARLDVHSYALPAGDAAALAEAKLGAGQRAETLLYVHLGREVLSAVVCAGKLLPSAHGLSGQLGHWPASDVGPRCSCGVVGHLNPIASSQSIVRLAIGLAAQDDEAMAAVHRVTGGRAESLRAGQVVALAEQGIAPLRELTLRAADALGGALGRLALALDPTLVILGGPLGVAGGLFLARVRERIRELLGTTREPALDPLIASAALEPHSALTGAWLLAQQSSA